MTSINRVLLVGNLTRDPELRVTQGGMSVVEFGLAVNGREKVNGEWQERADFFDVTVFGNQGDSVAQYCSKGSQVGVDGRLRQERWQTKDTHENRSRVKIIADSVQFLARTKGQEDGGGQFVPAAAATSGDFTPPDDDIPF